MDDTDLTIADIAFASGFGSLRQFNRTMREIFRSSPQQLRERRQRADRLAADGGLTLRLPITPPYDWPATLAFLAAHAIPGVEVVDGDVYRRTITLDGAAGLLEIWSSGHDHLLLRAHLPYWEGLIHVVERVRRMLSLDVDVAFTAPQLAADPVIGPLIAARPGLRPLGAWAPFEVGVHIIVGQKCDQAEATAHMGTLVQAYGPAVPGLPRDLTHAFPGAETLATADPQAIEMPPATAHAIRSFAAAVQAGDIRLDGTVDLDSLVASVTAVPGISATAAHHLALRLGERDAFPQADPSLRRVLRALDPQAENPVSTAERWRPSRSLATTHLLAYHDLAASVAFV